MKTLGERIRKCRKEKGLSQKKLADLLDIQYQSVQDWERDRTKPSTGKIEKLCEIFNVTPTWLLFGKVTEPLNKDKMAVRESEMQYGSSKNKRCIELFEKFSPKTQEIVIKLMEMLASKYKTDNK